MLCAVLCPRCVLAGTCLCLAGRWKQVNSQPEQELPGKSRYGSRGKRMDPNVTVPERPPSLLRMLDAALQIGLVALLIYACSRIILPFTGILLWSAILAVMLYPLHLRLAVRLGNRWSALLIGLVGVAVMLVPMVIVVTSLGSSIFSLVSGLQNHSLTVPPPPPRLADLPLVGQKLTETWALVATNMPAALAKYGEMLSGLAAWLVSFAGGLAAGRTVVRSFFRDRRRARRLWQGCRRIRSAPVGTRHRQQGARGPAGYADRRHDPRRGGGRCRRGGDPVAAHRGRLLRHWPSGSRPFDARDAFAGYRAGAGDAGDAACHGLCPRDRSNDAGDHLCGLDPRRRAQRQYPQAIDARPRTGSADAGHSDWCHRRHDCRRPSRPVCRARAAGRRLCAAHGMAAAAPGRGGPQIDGPAP